MASENQDLLRIRPIATSHIADVIHIAEETNLSPWSAQNYLDEMKNPDSVMVRLDVGGNKTAGFIVGRLVPGSQIDSALDAEIFNIAVIQSQQGKGLGQLLFNAFADACRQRSAANVWLEVRQSNEKAITFYEKNGFERVQTRAFFYENPREHAVLMRLVLKY